MADKKAKNILSHREKALKYQRNKDRETLEHLKYVGKQLEQENSLIKSQILEMRKPVLTERSLPSMTQSMSSVQLPPIRRVPSSQKESFLKDVRDRDWKMYMSSREVIKDNDVNDTYNHDLKRKLFNQKYNMFMKQTKESCHDTWNRLEMLRANQGDHLDDPSCKTKHKDTSKQAPKDKPQAPIPKTATVEPKPADTKTVLAPKENEF